jgi:hypothetical protein
MKRTLFYALGLLLMAVSGCASSDTEKEAGVATTRTAPEGAWHGSKPVRPEKPVALGGFRPGSQHRDPYTGKVRTASPDGEITMD